MLRREEPTLRQKSLNFTFVNLLIKGIICTKGNVYGVNTDLIVQKRRVKGPVLGTIINKYKVGSIYEVEIRKMIQKNE